MPRSLHRSPTRPPRAVPSSCSPRRNTESAAAIECGAVYSQLAALQDDLGMHADARRSYDRFAELSPLMETEVQQWLAARRSDVCYDLGDIDATREYAKQAGEGFGVMFGEVLAVSNQAIQTLGIITMPHSTFDDTMLQIAANPITGTKWPTTSSRLILRRKTMRFLRFT